MPGPVPEVIAQAYDPAVPVDSLREWPGNPNDGDVGAISASLDALGFYGAILVQKSSGRVMSGNHRLRAARAMNMTTLPVLWCDMDDEEARAVLIGENEHVRRGTWNMTALVEFLKDTAVKSPQLMPVTAFDGDDLDRLIAELQPFPGEGGQPDRGDLLAAAGVTVGEPRHQVADGQAWHLGDHVLVVADVFTGHRSWVPYLEEGAVFLPYPTPLAPHAQIEGRLVMVQPEPYLAGHLLDKWERITGKPPELAED